MNVMQFRETVSIYLQIADYICERILLKQWKVDERIPSVRELAMQLEVNPNTVMRTYDFMQQQSIIYNQRGIGYFVSPDAVQIAMLYRKTGNLRACQLLLGHTKLESTVRYLGVELDDALALSEALEI